ncbi:hypothetical protein [Pseudomonas sp. RL]|uniref:hypothetical protein n=1 Tax=Pseudomonas sp. RL TaxID=1452718 RepID=UPI000B1E0D8E|nr:hypothetical protein [Pseudomonas sp. RL]
MTNSGQICVSPDLVYIAIEHKQAFIDAFRAAVISLYPNANGNPDLVADPRRDFLHEDLARRALHC